ncbi:tyrosine-protein phosphatase [Streptomyces sp. NPDC091272]|uniref:tyrosine-protein phosphatase n=1 Tax=Streptomyces sp. NPDC091272 TaxID=3365981 RepID=UPI003817A8BE
MQQKTPRVRALAYSLTAAAVLAGLTAPVATASPAARPSEGRHASERIPFTAAEVTAQRDGSYKITWKAPGVRRVAVRADGRTVALGGSVGSVVVRGLSGTPDRQWFDLVPDRGAELRLADRLVKLDGTVNFRDAGGYRTSDGQWVRMGVVYRTDALDKLTDADLAKLKRLGIDTDYDLRTASERTSAPDRVPAGARYVVADVIGGSSDLSQLPKTAAAAEAMMIEGEKAMVSGKTAKAAYSTVFEGIADDAVGSLYHCTAGKDRTGWSSAVLLTALGVPKQTVMRDYLASNTYRAEANAATLAAMPADLAAVYKPLLDVRAEYLNSGFAEVNDKYGSFTSYQKRALGLDSIDVRKLKEQLLVG